MNCAIVYFSGTGNTKRVGDIFKTYLQASNYQVDMIDISEQHTPLKNYDLIIAGSPTYTMSSSYNVHAFLKEYVSKRNNPEAKFITYVTHGWGSSYGHLTLRDTVLKLGFKTVNASAFLAPSNFYMFNEEVQAKQDQEEILSLYKNIHAKVENVLQKHFEGKTTIDKHSIIKKHQIALMSKLVRKVFITQYSSKMLLVDEKKCTQCKVCVKKCPNGNIQLSNGLIEFEKNCSACARCMHICPQNAYIYKGNGFEQFDLHQKSIMELLENKL